MKPTAIYFDLAAGLLDPSVFGSGEVYALELEQVFSRCWTFLGPESWLKAPGDYLTSTIGEECVLVWRGRDDQVRAFSNFCLSGRGLVTHSPRGCSSRLACECHGWIYGSDGHSVDSPDVSLPGVSVASYKGLVFGCLDPGAPSLTEYLGDFTWYLDMLLERRAGGIEAYGDPPLRWLVEANWKLPMEAFAGDVYREATAHAATAQVLGQTVLISPEDGLQVSAGAGAIALSHVPNDTGAPEVLTSYEVTIRSEVRARLGEQRTSGSFPISGIVFPNLAIDWQTRTLHCWHPRGPSQTEVYTYCLVDVEAPIEVREAQRRWSQFLYGPAGMKTAEDVDPWRAISQKAKARSSRATPLNLQMGLRHERYSEDMPGRLSPLLSEMNQRYFYHRWQQLLSGTDVRSANLE